MEGWISGRRSYRGYLQEHSVGSDDSSSRSGTIVSTAYTSSASRPSNNSMEPAMHFYSLGIHEEEEHDGKYIRSLVQEFSIPLSENCSSKAGDMSVVERWLTELGVGWVLSLDAVVSAGVEELDRDAWTRALGHIAQTFSLMRQQFPDRGSLPSICQRGEEDVGQTCIPDRYHLVLFIQGSMLKMFTFIDVIVAWDLYAIEGFLLDQKHFFWIPSMPLPPSHKKLIALLGVHDALSEASNIILPESDNWPTSVEVHRIENEMSSLLLAYKSKAGEAIRSTMEKIRTKLMEVGDDSSSQQGSSDIHKVTCPAMTYTWVLLSNCSSVDAAICDQYVPRNNNVRPVHIMIIEMVSCLQEKLANISESFPDQGLKFLFLLNNTYFIQLFKSFYDYLDLPVDLSVQIVDYMKRYLQVSWAPLLSCLFNSTSLCLGNIYFPMSKFESEFQKIYTTQKQWKVRDPELRRSLREAITDKIIPGYTDYIQDNKVTNPKFRPQELKAMLQELFEG